MNFYIFANYLYLGTTIKLQEGESWVVVLVTSVMKRTQMLDAAKEMVFVDSTCSCEASSATMTILLAATKVGALPLAVLIHPFQTMDNYLQAFKLLKHHFPRCFGGNDVCFIY